MVAQTSMQMRPHQSVAHHRMADTPFRDEGYEDHPSYDREGQF